MWRRWIIRGLFMLPILLCAGGWVWSITHVAFLGYFPDEHMVGLDVGDGTIGLFFGQQKIFKNWIVSTTTNNSGIDRGETICSFIGFGIEHSHGTFVDGTTSDDGYRIGCPCWFPILHCTPLSCLAEDSAQSESQNSISGRSRKAKLAAADRRSSAIPIFTSSSSASHSAASASPRPRRCVVVSSWLINLRKSVSVCG